jgi:hypothetical protein
VRHGAKVRRCSSEGCSNQAVKGGVCMRHGAKTKRCSHEGCTNRAVKEGMCRRHSVWMVVQTMLSKEDYASIMGQKETIQGGKEPQTR